MAINKTITVAPDSKRPMTFKRFGYGTMRLTGEHIFGEPADRPEALRILRTAVDRGIQFLDTADYYGMDVTNRLIAEALHPYPKDLIICTKVGAIRKPDKGWYGYNKPHELRASIENNLKTLKLEQIQLVHFRVMTASPTPFEESMSAMFDMQKEGKILHVGVSNVTLPELAKARSMGAVASVENAFGYGQRTTFKLYGNENRGMQEVMDECVKNWIVMVPYWSLQNSLPKNDDKIAVIAEKYKATPAQINLAWLLHFNDLLLPIPGTSRLSHFEENLAAFEIKLTEDDMKFLG